MRTLGFVMFAFVLLVAGVEAQSPDTPAPSADETTVAPATAQPSAPTPSPVAPPQPAPPTAAPPAAPEPAPATPQPPSTVNAPPPPPATYAPPPNYAPPGAAPAPWAFQPQGSPLVAPSTSQAPAAPSYPTQPPQHPSYAPTYPAVRPQAGPATLTLPAPPPGYVYMAVPQTAPLPMLDHGRRDELYGELNRVNLKIDELERSRPSIGGPITMMIVGYGAALLSTTIALASVAAAEDIQEGRTWEDDTRDLDSNDDGAVDERDERRFRKTARISAAVAGGALVLGVFSTARLFARVAARRERRAELKELESRRNNLRRQLDFGASAWPGQMQLQLQGRF